jgi:hypothetical protein
LAGDLGRHLTPEEPRRAAIHLFDLYRFSHPDISVQPIRILASASAYTFCEFRASRGEGGRIENGALRS